MGCDETWTPDPGPSTIWDGGTTLWDEEFGTITVWDGISDEWETECDE